MQYQEDASGGIELFDMHKDPQQYHNLAKSKEHEKIVEEFKNKFAAKMAEIRDNDL